MTWADKLIEKVIEVPKYLLDDPLRTGDFIEGYNIALEDFNSAVLEKDKEIEEIVCNPKYEGQVKRDLQQASAFREFVEACKKVKK